MTKEELAQAAHRAAEKLYQSRNITQFNTDVEIGQIVSGLTSSEYALFLRTFSASLIELKHQEVEKREEHQ